MKYPLKILKQNKNKNNHEPVVQLFNKNLRSLSLMFKDPTIPIN